MSVAASDHPASDHGHTGALMYGLSRSMRSSVRATRLKGSAKSHKEFVKTRIRARSAGYDEPRCQRRAAPPVNRCWRSCRRTQHARLRIYIGAAPGVGKTYSMIDDAHALRREGVDVVDRLRGDPRARRHRSTTGGSRSDSRGAGSSTAASRWKKWISTRSSLAGPRCASSTSSRTPTPPAAGTRSAIRTSRSCWTRASA